MVNEEEYKEQRRVYQLIHKALGLYYNTAISFKGKISEAESSSYKLSYHATVTIYNPTLKTVKRPVEVHYDVYQRHSSMRGISGNRPFIVHKRMDNRTGSRRVRAVMSEKELRMWDLLGMVDFESGMHGVKSQHVEDWF